jgi:DNA-binding CsgD family transcriptional regulator
MQTSNKRRANAKNSHQPLSGREQEVFDLLMQGLYYREISARLEIAYETVHSHARNIYKKLRVRSRNQAVAKLIMHRAARAGRLVFE